MAPTPGPAQAQAGCRHPRVFSYRLRRLATQHDWRSRTGAFDNYRADASGRALDQLLQQEAFDWKDRTEQFRLTEWALHELMLQAATAAAHEVRKHPNRVSPTGLMKLYELASTLGRRACGMPLDGVEPKPEPPSLRPEFEAALNKVYGPPPDAAASAPPQCNESNGIFQPRTLSAPSEIMLAKRKFAV